MNRRELIEELTDFFERRNRFEVCNDYPGMEASRLPEVFMHYFDGLSVADRKLLTATIVAGALGEVGQLNPYLDVTVSLMFNLALTGRTQYFGDERRALEDEFNSQRNLETWAKAGDDESPSGPEYKRAWRYALILWGVLYLLKSDAIETSYQSLQRHARSEHFKRALAAARRMYDSGVLEA
ncbi:MAG: hypothetical protein QOH49_551 [Acidobacteriota bacterium]|nr:hypothetical protein [Acidobacteriota bacterium]